MTWKEFKEKAESAGVKDGDVISMIDLTGLGFINEELSISKTVDKTGKTKDLIYIFAQ